VSEYLGQFKGSVPTTLALGSWSFGTHVQRLPDHHAQCQTGSNSGVATMTCQQLALAAVVVVRWSKDLNVNVLGDLYFL
jgi:hypothetical protein